MKTLILTLISLLPIDAHAAHFECTPLSPPREQGEERFYKVEITDQEAKIEVADLVSPYTDLSKNLELRYSHYSDTASNVGAAWAKDGRDELVISLMFFGSWWGGNLRTHDEELDLRCKQTL